MFRTVPSERKLRRALQQAFKGIGLAGMPDNALNAFVAFGMHRLKKPESTSGCGDANR